MNRQEEMPPAPRSASAPIASTITTPLKKGNCFSCGKPGHWASECPNKRSTGSFSQPILNTSRVASPGYSQVICRCGAGVCEPRVAKSDGNVYYTCPAKSWMRCDFFTRHSKLNSGGVRRLEYPICGCGAGVCVLGREAATDREYFKCRVPKGQGACSFKQWVDEPVSYTKSVTVEETDYLRTHQRLGKRVNHPLSEEDDPHRKSLRITEMDGSPNANTRRFSSNTLTSFVSSDTKAGSSLMSTMELDDISPELMREIMEYDCPLSEDDESSCKLRKTPESEENMVSLSPSAQLSWYSAVSLGSLNTIEFPAQVEVMALGSTITNVDQRADLSYGSQMEEVVNTAPAKLHDHNTVQRLQANFERRIVAAATDHSQGKCTSAMLGAQYLGWLSRLAFASPRCSILPLDQNVFPNFDPVNVRQSFLEDVPAINLKEPSAPGSPTYIGEPDNVIAAAILKAFGQATMLIQTNFIARLESMNRSSHESMTKEANTFFASLDHLKVDYRPFHQRVKDFIDAAASLNQIENSISNDALFQDTLDRLNKEKLRLGQLSSEYSSEMKSFTCSQEIVLSLINEAEEVRNRLLRIEQQVSACQMETNDLNTRLGELSDQISECQNNLLSTSLEAEAAHKLFLQKQAELSSARNTFEKAKFQLRDKDGAFPKSIWLMVLLRETPLAFWTDYLAMPLANEILLLSLRGRSTNSYFMDVKCQGCFTVTIFSHSRTDVACPGCQTILCQPTGGKARLTEGCSFRKKGD